MKRLTEHGSKIKGDGNLESMPRVLLVGSALTGGGAETRFRLLARYLFGGTADVAVLKETDEERLNDGQLLTRLGWRGPRSYPAMLSRLNRLIRTRDYDAILSFGLYPNTLAWGALRLSGRESALILTEITRPHTESIRSGGARHLISHAVRRLSYPRADMCAANSEDGLLEIVHHYAVQEHQVRRVPNLVEPEQLADLARFGGEQSNIDGHHIICAVSRLDPIKRIDTLLEALAGIANDLLWRLKVVGDGPDRKRLERIAKDLGIGDRVEFLGWCSNPYPTIKGSTVTVLTSEYEGFSNTVLESMILGTPVITSFCSSDARQMVKVGAALGFPVGDIPMLRSKLTILLSSPQVRKELSESALLYARANTIPCALPQYESLVQEAIMRKSRVNRV